MGLIGELIWGKQDPIFEAAKDIVRQVKEKMSNPNNESVVIRLPKDKWVDIVPGNIHTPKMMCFENGTKIIISFPANSTPYCDKITTKVKKCIVFSGTIYDMNNPENRFENGDEFKVYPWNPVVPYTKDLPALAYVELE